VKFFPFTVCNKLLFRCVLLFGLVPSAVFAEILPEDLPWGKCPDILDHRVATTPIPGVTPAAGVTYIDADHADTKTRQTYEFSGNVIIEKDGRTVNTEHAIYNEPKDTVTAQGNVRIEKEGTLITGNRAELQMSTDKGQVEHVEFFVQDKHLRGTAERVDILNKQVSQYSMATYTTCMKGDNGWLLNAGSLELDTGRNEGTAQNVWLTFQRVPLFYFPYITFPLAGRKTGFLIPEFGTSSRLGTRVSIPFYWNIAPNRDATLTLQNFTGRGQQFLGEFRYLNRYNSGQVNVEYLPNDKVTKTNRLFYSLRHNASLLPRLTANIDYKYASDKDYFEDFGDRLSTTSILNLERKANIGYKGRLWTASASVLDIQTFDRDLADSARPYKKLPQLDLQFNSPQTELGPQYDFSAELIRFVRNERVSGRRLDLQPSISWPIEGAPAYFKPKLTLRQTQYSLDNQSPDINSRQTRTIPIFSVDTTVFFERELKFGNSEFLQTLEPQLFYLNVPYKDQSNLIVDQNGKQQVFDSALATPSYSQLFAENRFTGADRVGDTEQITLALTTRFLGAQTGVEYLTASIGRSYYFADRRVTLPGGRINTRERSDLFGVLRANPVKNLKINATVQWDPELDAAKEGNFQLQYVAHKNKLFNLGYQLSRNDNGDIDIQEHDLSFVWAVDPYWSWIFRRNYSILEKRSKEYMIGLEYDSCCWAFRIVRRRYFSGTENTDGTIVDNYSDDIWFQLELKGLSSIGRKVNSLLEHSEHGIRGYQ
jgi:LPS-assembly protein